VSSRRKDRTARRADARKLEKLLRKREELAAHEPGGTPDNPIELSSASLVEPRAESTRCLRCDGDVRVEAHDAVMHGATALRLARVRCRSCGHERRLWYALPAATLH